MVTIPIVKVQIKQNDVLDIQTSQGVLSIPYETIMLILKKHSVSYSQNVFVVSDFLKYMIEHTNEDIQEHE